MAFDFLSSPSTSSWLNPDTGENVPISGSDSGMGNISNLLGLVGGASALNTTLKGYQPTQAEGAQGQAMSNQNALLRALLDPNNTIYKNVYAGEQQELNNQTLMGLNNLLQMQRKAQLMGRGTYFNPDRQDESINRYLQNQTMNNAAIARSNALNQIITAANGYGGQARNYGDMIKNQQAAQDRNNQTIPNATDQIAKMLPQAAMAAAMFM